MGKPFQFSMRRMFYSTGWLALAAWSVAQGSHPIDAFAGFGAVLLGAFAIGMAIGTLAGRIWLGIAAGLVSAPLVLTLVS